MRDDVFGLSLLRAMPQAGRATPVPATTLKAPAVGAQTSFSNQLALAARDRAAAALKKPYVSPLQQNQSRTISPSD